MRRVFRPSGAEFDINTNPGLAPGLRPGLRSCAAPRQTHQNYTFFLDSTKYGRSSTAPTVDSLGKAALCQGGEFAFSAGYPRPPCPADDFWVVIRQPCLQQVRLLAASFICIFSGQRLRLRKLRRKK